MTTEKVKAPTTAPQFTSELDKKPDQPEAAPVKASITLSNLKHALKIVGAAIERNPTIPALQCVRMEQIDKGFALESTNLDIFIRVVLSELGGPQQPILTAAEKFTAWTKLLAGEDVRISATDKRAAVQCGRARAVLPVFPADRWPCTDLYKIHENGVTLTQGSFARALRHALVSVSDAASRYTLNGIQVTGDGTSLRMVSTDGYRLTLYTIPCAEKINALLPGGFVKALLPLLDDEDGGIDLAFSPDVVLASIDADTRVYVASKKISGSFPNWEAVMPAGKRTEVTAKVAELMVSLERCLLLADERSLAVDFSFASEITITAVSALEGEARETVDCQGAPSKEFRTRLNGKLLLDMLKKLDGELRISLPESNSSPLLFKAEPYKGETLDYVVMPMRM